MMNKQWPQHFGDKIIQGDSSSSVGIVTLWTNVEQVAKNLADDQKSIALMGQLYSKDGINWILRNVLANPVIRKIAIVGQDLSGSGEALIALVKNGIEENGSIIGVENATIHAEIQKSSIELFRKNVEIIDLRGKVKKDEIMKGIGSIENLDPWAEPVEFPEPVLHSPDTMPSERCSFRLEGEKVGDVWLKVLDTIMRFGHVKKSQHSSDQREIPSLVAVVTGENLEDIDWKSYFNFTQEELKEYIPQVTTANPVENVDYTYGQLLRDHDGIDQIQSMIEQLKEAKYSRRAVAVTWNVARDHKNAHAPCLDLIQGLVQGDELFFTVFIRSNDMYRAWPRNVIAFMHLQKIIADACGFKMGPFTMVSGSAHIYSDCWNEVRDLLVKHAPSTACQVDPRGNFVIQIEDSSIKVKQMSPSGHPIAEFSGLTARELMEALHTHQSISDIGHALDIGAELQKAEIAIKKGIEYVQDQVLKI